MAVARDHLRRDRLGLKAELLRHVGFDPWIDMGEGADRARNGASRDLVPRRDEPCPGAGELGIGDGELEPEGGGLRMHAVTTADGQRVLVLEGADLQRFEQRIDIGNEQVGGLHELKVEAGVEHIGGGQALMQKARLRSHLFRDAGQEGDDIVLHLPLDLVDAGDVKAAALLHRHGRLLRDQPELGHGLGGQSLDLEPNSELGLGLPNASHFGAAVAGDHFGVRDPFLRRRRQPLV